MSSGVSFPVGGTKSSAPSTADATWADSAPSEAENQLPRTSSHRQAGTGLDRTTTARQARKRMSLIRTCGIVTAGLTGRQMTTS